MSTTLKTRIESYDVTPNGLMRQSTIFRLCQRAAGDDLDKFGGSFETLVSHGLTFVITKMEITYFADIKTYDEIEIVTYPRGVKGPSFIRDYDILKNGERVAYASSYWVLIDFEKRRFCRPSAISEVCEIVPDMDNLYEMEMRKLHPDINEMVKSDERKVYYSSIDRNNHMNNTFYPDILFDYLPESYLDTLSGKTITVQYNSEILCGENFSVYTKEENGEFTLSARCEKEDRDIFSAMITK